jgi:Spy/CpxP family protein refolding chaperone
MKTKCLLAAALALATPLVYAQDATSAPPPSSQDAPGPGQPSPRSRDMNRDWGPGRDGADRHGGGMEGRDRGDRDHGDGMLPFGMWWKDPEVVKRVGVTPDQTKRMDALMLQSRLQLIHLHATLQEEQLLLEPMLDASPFDEAKALEQINKIADTRADLEKTNAKMLLNIRGVLTGDQWTKLRSHDHGGPRPAGGWRDAHPDGPPRAN